MWAIPSLACEHSMADHSIAWPLPLPLVAGHFRQSDISQRLDFLRNEIAAERNDLAGLLLVKKKSASDPLLAQAKASVAASDSALHALQALHENALESIHASDRVIEALKAIVRTHGVDDLAQRRTLGDLQSIIDKNRINLEANAVALTAVNALAFTDPLTGLPNRRLLVDRLKQMVLSNRRWETYSAAVYLDLDKFKRLNDEFGHECGDELLIAVGNR